MVSGGSGHATEGLIQAQPVQGAMRICVIGAGYVGFVRGERLSSPADSVAAARAAEVIFVCVQTPSMRSGGIALLPVKSACKSVGKALRRSNGRKLVVVKSTVV